MNRLFQPEPRDVKRGERLEMRADGSRLTNG